ISSPSWVSSSPRSSPRTSSGVRVPSTLTLVRRSSVITRETATPTSAVISASSISSQVSSSSRSRDSRLSSTEPIELCDRASRARSRTRRPADGGGRSTSSTPVAAAGVSGTAGVSAVAVSPPPADVAEAGGVTGVWADGGARVRPRRGRWNSSRPPAPRARTAMTMIRITYSIRTPVLQTPRDARAPPAARRQTAEAPGRTGAAGRSRSRGPAGRRRSRTGRLGGLAGGELLADDGGDAVAAHGDAVEGVRGFHSPALVGDDDELRALPQFLEDQQQPLQVGVTWRGLDLVEQVERGGAGLEDGEQVGDGGQRPLPAGQQGEPLDLLTGRPGLDLDAGGEHVVGLGEDQVALAAGEQAAEEVLELARGVGVGRGEHLLHPVVHLLDHGQQVPPGLAEVVELGGQERVPFGQRLVLLQGQRVALAQPVELLARLGRPALGRDPLEARRRCVL